MKFIRDSYPFTLSRIGEREGNISYIIEVLSTELGFRFFYAEEEKSFYKTFQVGDQLVVRLDRSPKFGTCLLFCEHVSVLGERQDISSRRILIHGSNENGQVTNANSANCWIPLRELNYTFSEGMFFTKLGVSKAETRSWIDNLSARNMTDFVLTLKSLDNVRKS